MESEGLITLSLRNFSQVDHTKLPELVAAATEINKTSINMVKQAARGLLFRYGAVELWDEYIDKGIEPPAEQVLSIMRDHGVTLE